MHKEEIRKIYIYIYGQEDKRPHCEVRHREAVNYWNGSKREWE